MAKRRKKSAPRRRSRRSVGAVNSGMITDVLGIVAGAVIAKKVDSMLPNLNPTMRNGAKLAAGVLLPTFIKNPMVASIGKGMIAMGGAQLVGTLLPALGATDEVLVLSGIDEISEVNRLDEIGSDIAEVNGLDEIGEVDFEVE